MLKAQSVEELRSVVDALDERGWLQPNFHADSFDPKQARFLSLPKCRTPTFAICPKCNSKNTPKEQNLICSVSS